MGLLRQGGPIRSLGIVDNVLRKSYTGCMGTLEVVDWLFAVQAVIRPLQIHLWTWDGRMHLSCSLTEAFYRRTL
jgi:hypothetical protein